MRYLRLPLVVVLAIASAHAVAGDTPPAVATGQPAGAAAAEPARQAKEKLEQLKKRLPDALKTWQKKYGLPPANGDTPRVLTLRRVRATGPTAAKLTFSVHLQEENGKPSPTVEAVLLIYLNYYDGLWTAAQFQFSSAALASWNTPTHLLLDAIDEAAEK